MRKRLVGGSAGMTKHNFTHPFVQQGVKLFESGENQVSRVRLLPAFVKDINGCVTDPESFVPYRISKGDGEEHGAFTDWFVEITGYRMLGPNKLRFLSPTTGQDNAPGGVDPLVDLFRASRASEDPAVKWFTQKEGKSKQDRMRSLQWPSRMYLINILLLNDENQLENQILKLSGKGMEALSNMLNNPATHNTPERPEFNEYVFGDVLAPDSGLWGTVKPFKFGDADMTTSGVFYGRKLNDWDSVEAYPFDPLSPDGRIFLRGRHDLCDTEKVLRFPDRQEMVEAIFAGLPWLPYNWAAAVLMDFGYVVPKNPHQHTMVSQPALASQPAAAPAPARSVAPTAARPAAPAPARPAAPVASQPARPAVAAPARPVAPTAPAAARPAAPIPARPAAAAPAAMPRPATAPRPTVATVAPVAQVVDEPELAEAGLAPAIDTSGGMTPELEAELGKLEESLQNDPAGFPPDGMARLSELVALRDANAIAQ